MRTLLERAEDQRRAHDRGDACDLETCQECCEHNEFDHYVCMDCGYEKCPGDDIDAAEYSSDEDR